MRCSRVDRYIERYLDERLPQYRRQQVAEHLRGCPRCQLHLEEAKGVTLSLEATERQHAPEGFSARVMNEVFREQRQARREEPRRPEVGRIYRRLGYSFVTTAAVLTLSLFVPRIAYSNLIHADLLAANLEKGRPASVERIINNAGQGMRSMIGGETVETGVR